MAGQYGTRHNHGLTELTGGFVEDDDVAARLIGDTVGLVGMSTIPHISKVVTLSSLAEFIGDKIFLLGGLTVLNGLVRRPVNFGWLW